MQFFSEALETTHNNEGQLRASPLVVLKNGIGGYCGCMWKERFKNVLKDDWPER